MNNEEYVNIEATDVESVAVNSLEPLEQIRYAAKKFGVEIKDPNPNCRSCHGRGYTGKRKTGEPVACHCIQPEMNEATEFAYDNRQFVPRNRRERRYAMKMMKRQLKKGK